MLLVPAIYVRTMPHGTTAPSFDMSAAARPEADAGPRATWLSPDRIVVEPEVVPIRPALTSGGQAAIGLTPAPAAPASAPVSSPVAKQDKPDKQDSAGAPPATTVAAVATTTTEVPRAAETTTTTAVAPTTTTPTTIVPVVVTLPPALTPLAPASKAATRSESGRASWFHAPDGTCAHRTAPKGVVIKVTRVATGASTTCIVDDWGPADASRIIDLSLDTFEQLATSDAGVIDVTIEW